MRMPMETSLPSIRPFCQLGPPEINAFLTFEFQAVTANDSLREALLKRDVHN